MAVKKSDTKSIFYGCDVSKPSDRGSSADHPPRLDDKPNGLGSGTLAGLLFCFSAYLDDMYLILSRLIPSFLTSPEIPNSDGDIGSRISKRTSNGSSLR